MNLIQFSFEFNLLSLSKFNSVFKKLHFKKAHIKILPYLLSKNSSQWPMLKSAKEYMKTCGFVKSAYLYSMSGGREEDF